MMALDTNVLVRFLVEDDPLQSRAAQRLVKKAIQAKDVLFLSDLVLVETVWVLGRSYRLARDEIGKILQILLSAQHLRFESTDRLSRALRAYQRGKGGFADYLIRELARDHGAAEVATFDRKLLKEAGFKKP